MQKTKQKDWLFKAGKVAAKKIQIAYDRNLNIELTKPF